MVRLYIAYRYSNPIYQLKLITLNISSGLIVISGISLGAFATVTLKPEEYDGAHVLAYCRFSSPPITASMFGLYDIIFSLGTLFAFVNPLRKLIKGILLNKNMTEAAQNDLDVEGLIYVGVKCVILTSVATLSTFLLIVAIGMMQLAWLTPIDMITNMVCMMLMTNYYDDKKFYERVCIVNIKCSAWCLGCCCGYRKMGSTKIEMAPSNSEIYTNDTTTRNTMTEPDLNV